MGLPTYYFNDLNPDDVAHLLQGKGYSVSIEKDPDLNIEVKHGWGMCSIIALKDSDHFHLVCGSNPIRWWFDMRLHKKLDKLLVTKGAQFLRR